MGAMDQDTEGQTMSKEEAFSARMNEVVKSGFITLGLALGNRLGLFRAMCDIDSPATAKHIAESVHYKERLGLFTTYTVRCNCTK